MYGRLRKSWLRRTGPTICTTSGLCVPGASCILLDRPVCCVCLALFPCANNATAMPKRQNTEAIRTRRLKKADLDVDFFFISGSGVDFPLRKTRDGVVILCETLKACQHSFWNFL